MTKEAWDIIKEIIDDDTWLEETAEDRQPEEKGLKMPTEQEMLAGGWKKLTGDSDEKKAQGQAARDQIFFRLERLKEDLRQSFPDINQMRPNDLRTALEWISEYETFVKSTWSLAYKVIDANAETDHINLEVRSLVRLETQYKNKLNQIEQDQQRAVNDAQRAAREAKRQADHDAWQQRREAQKQRSDAWWEQQRKDKKRRDRQHKRWMATHLGQPYIEIDVEIDD